MIVSFNWMWQLLSIDIGILGQEIGILGLWAVFFWEGGLRGLFTSATLVKEEGQKFCKLNDPCDARLKAMNTSVCIHCLMSLRAFSRTSPMWRIMKLTSFPNPTFFHTGNKSCRWWVGLPIPQKTNNHVETQ